MAICSFLIFLLFTLQAWASPCLEVYKRFAQENKDKRNDERIALEMLYSEVALETLKTESYFFLKNAVVDLSKNKKVETSFSELQAHIYAGFDSGEFCKDAKPRKSAGQIIRIAKDQVKDAREEVKDINKLFDAPNLLPLAGANLGFDSEREPSGRILPKKQE